MNSLRFKQNGQSLIELMVGLSLVTVVVGALAIITTYGLRNSQFSKNQSQATKYAQENLEKVRAIRSGNYGICPPSSACTTWDSTFWTRTFSAGEKYTITSCSINSITVPYCLVTMGGPAPTPTPAPIANTVFSQEVIVLNEPISAPPPYNQKKVISRVYWTDNTGQHSSDLVTILSSY